MLPNFINP